MLEVLQLLAKQRLIRNVTAQDVQPDSILAARKSGAYFTKVLARRFNYIEECMTDTAIDDERYWGELREQSIAIANERKIAVRMRLRQKRLETFLDYLELLEKGSLGDHPAADLRHIEVIRQVALAEVKLAVVRATKRGGNV
jgi:hypothetical protein